MKKTMLPAALAGIFLGGCATVSPTAATPPPFECTSINPEVCSLEKRAHILRLEQAQQNAAIQAAEQKRKAELNSS